MSIGLLNMRLHLKIVDSHRFQIRKVSGGPSSILSADGQNVDVDVGVVFVSPVRSGLLAQKCRTKTGTGSPLF